MNSHNSYKEFLDLCVRISLLAFYNILCQDDILVDTSLPTCDSLYIKFVDCELKRPRLRTSSLISLKRNNAKNTTDALCSLGGVFNVLGLQFTAAFLNKHGFPLVPLASASVYKICEEIFSVYLSTVGEKYKMLLVMLTMSMLEVWLNKPNFDYIVCPDNAPNIVASVDYERLSAMYSVVLE